MEFWSLYRRFKNWGFSESFVAGFQDCLGLFAGGLFTKADMFSLALVVLEDDTRWRGSVFEKLCWVPKSSSPASGEGDRGQAASGASSHGGALCHVVETWLQVKVCFLSRAAGS